MGSVIELLQRHRLLKPAQLAELASWQGKPASSQELVKELVRRGWLTPFQGRQLLAGKADRLLMGRYVLLDQLGSGGSGHVFKARHQHMDRIVALKVLRGDLLQDADAVGRFYREVEVLSQLAHPAIVHAYDAGVVGSSHFLAMEFIDGIDLERQVKESGPLPLAQACEYIRQAAAGLQYAHERGLVHRDIKPSNLLVVPSAGVVKILDLGLARLREPAALSKTGNLTALAGASVMMGTPDYMAPEQAIDFHAADIRADIYSLGCTLYFLLAGRPPVSGSLTMKLAQHQQGELPPIPALAQQPALAGVLARMLARRPEDRFQTPGEVAEALAQAVRGLAASGIRVGRSSEPETAIEEITAFDPSRSRPTWSRWIVGLAAGGVGLLLLAGTVWLVAGRRLAPPAPSPPPSVLQFHGKDQLVVLPDDLFRGAPVLTIEVWFRTRDGGGILGYQNSAFPAVPGSYVPVLSVGADGKLRAQFWDNGVHPVTSPMAVNDGRWHHAALVCDGQSQVLYLDGTAVASQKSQPLNHLNMSKNQLGASFTGGWPGGNGHWFHFAGQVAELRVWHLARPAEAIRRDMYGLWPGSHPGLAAWYPMRGPAGNELLDASGHGRNGQLGGGDPKRGPTWIPVTEEMPRR